MDKLKPFLSGLLTHHYWILSLVVISLPIWAWRGMASEADQKIAAQKSAIDGAEGRIKGLSGPNKKWVESATKINKENKEQQKKSIDSLYLAQGSEIIWPESVAQDVADRKIGYRNQFTHLDIADYFSGDLAEGKGYLELIDALIEKLDPYDEFTGKGKTLVPLNPHDLIVPYPGSTAWPTPRPKAQDMWDALEDISLQTSIVDALADLNRPAVSIGTSVIKKVSKIRLVGGEHSNFRDDASFKPTETAGGGDGSRDGDAPLTRSSRDEDPPRGRDQGNKRGGDNDDSRSVTTRSGNRAGFAISSQFGEQKVDPNSPEAQAEAKRAQNTKTETREAGSSRFNDDEEDAEIAAWKAKQAAKNAPKTESIAFDSAGYVERKIDRYIDNSDKLEYVTRGFYIELTMDHRKIPELIGNLTNMKYPTVIARVHSVSLKHNQSDFSSQKGRGGRGARGGFNPRGGASMGGSRDREDDDDARGDKKEDTSKKTAPTTEATLLSDPYLVDVAIGGYMAIFKSEILDSEIKKTQSKPDDTDKEKSEDGDQEEEKPASETPMNSTPANKEEER